jgi:hypothetical protein
MTPDGRFLPRLLTAREATSSHTVSSTVEHDADHSPIVTVVVIQPAVVLIRTIKHKNRDALLTIGCAED